MNEYVFIYYIILLVLLTLFFVFSLSKMWNIDGFCAILYLLIFYFGVSILVTYLFSVESLWKIKNIQTNIFSRDRDSWLELYVFFFLSLITYWYVVIRGMKRLRKKIKQCFVILPSKHKEKISHVVLIILLIISMAQLFLLINYFDKINYWTFNNISFREQNPMFNILSYSVVFSIGWLSSLISLIIYSENKVLYRKKILCLAVIIMSFVFFVYTLKAGDRSSIISLIFGIFVPALYKKKVSIKGMVKSLFGIFFLYLMMQVLVSISRKEVVLESIIQVFFPTGVTLNSINLFAIIRYHVVSFSEGIKAILLKSIVGIKYTYLYELIAPYFSRVVVDGVSGFGYYLFADGYFLFGNLGFLYNGIVFGLLTVLWRKMAISQDKDLNIALTAFQSSMILSVVRSTGTCYVIKQTYMSLVPCVLFYVVLRKKRIGIKR